MVWVEVQWVLSQTKRPAQRLTSDCFRSMRAMTCGLSRGLWESGLVKFSAPGVLGSGQYWRS